MKLWSDRLEALAVVWAVKHFRPYLYGHRCDVYTDHEALRSLLNTPHPSSKLARWGLAIQELDLQIHYRPGKRNANADALSRSPVVQELNASSSNPADVIGMVGVVQTSLTIARLLVEHVVSWHGFPTGLLSDRGTAFLSNMMKEVYQLLGVDKVNTTAYHPQTDGLVE